MELKNKTRKLEFKEVENTIDELLNEYGEKAAEIAKSPISIYETESLMSLQEEMSLKIFNTFEIDKYKTTGQYILKSSISANREKYIYKTLLGKILRLIPAGVTILSVGINSSLARRFTLALGYAISQLSKVYINLIIDNKDMDAADVFTKEAIEDLMESYLIEYNKTVLN